MKKAPDWVKQSVLTICGVGAIAAWFSIWHVPALIDSHNQGMSTDIATLKADVGNTKTDIQRIDSTVNGMVKQLLEAELESVKGIKKQNTDVARDKLNFVSSLLGNAKQAGIAADPTIVAEAGKSTLELAKNPSLRDAAWNANRYMLAYRSFLNSREIPSAQPMTPVPNAKDFLTAFKFRPIPGNANPAWNLYIVPGFFSGSDAALLTGIGQESDTGPRYFILDAPGMELRLDGEHLRNVIIHNTRLVYEGGPVILERVYFVNCTFVVLPTPNGETLSAAVLETGPATTFRRN